MEEKLESIVQAARNLADKAQDKAGAGAEAVREALGRIGDLGELGREATGRLAEDLNELLPAIRRAGYQVRGIDLDVAVPPRVAVHCHLEAEVSADDRAALLAALEGRAIAAAAIRALFQVSDLQKSIAVGSLVPSDVILELGLSPAVKVRYRERDSGIAP
jgi:hypothetical protein